MNQQKEYSVEKGFISKIVETKDFKSLKEQQIKSNFFTGENRRVFNFIVEQYPRTGDIPTPRVLHKFFPNYSLETHIVDGEEVVGNDESFMFWCEQIRIKSRHNRTADLIEETAKKLDNGETEKAFEELKKGVWTIQDDTTITSTVDITKNAEERKEAYLKKKMNKGMLGIPTGISHLDYILKGLEDETLTTLIATPGIGKTWFLVKLASYAMLNSYRVKVYVTEMSSEIMQDRFDAMLYSMMYGDFDYEAFRAGRLSAEKEKSYFNFLEEKEKLEPLKIETATDVSSILATFDSDKPDIIFVDGAYLMEDDQGADSDWLRVTHITRALKRLAKDKHIPVFINSQADKSTSKKTGPELESISYAQSIGQDSDNILALYRDAVMKNDREMGVKVLKQREGILGRVVISWDFKSMNFDSIYSESASEESSDEEIDKETEDRIIKD